MSECIYKEMQTAKNGTLIPVFQNGRTLFSTYNPERDVENFCAIHKEAFENAGCILIGGIGNALHLISLAKMYPNARIIGVESDEASLSFSVSHLAHPLPENVQLTESSQLTALLPSQYIPALHGNFAFAAVRSWADYLGERMANLISLINTSINTISADYSVQAQFGKLWHRNILVNLSMYDSLKANHLFNTGTFSTAGRKAAVIGAGPSLDKSIITLAEHRTEYCIFATDTAFSTLTSTGITPDFVITVDSQQVSEKHFIGQNLTETILATDLTGNSSIIKNAIDQGGRIFFFHNSHPLSILIDSWLSETKGKQSPIPYVDSGAGTVLHAAADLARKLGFAEPVFFGADFAYSNGKPYTKGTYLEKQYYAADVRDGNAETAYTQLMFRTPIISNPDGTVTTEVLSHYKTALANYLKHVSPTFKNSKTVSQEPLFNDFIPWYLEKLHEMDEKVYFSLLPLAAWYKKNFLNADIESVYAYAEKQTAHVGRIQCHHQKKQIPSQ